MKLNTIFFTLILISTINGCATYTDGWVYDEKTDKYLSGQEIKNLISGNTIVYSDTNGTKEYYDKSGIMFIFYQTDDEYHNSHWCIKENKLCIDSLGFKLICPKIKIKSNGSMSYDQDVIKIETGDSYDIKKTYNENNWEIHAMQNCTF